MGARAKVHASKRKRLGTRKQKGGGGGGLIYADIFPIRRRRRRQDAKQTDFWLPSRFQKQQRRRHHSNKTGGDIYFHPGHNRASVIQQHPMNKTIYRIYIYCTCNICINLRLFLGIHYVRALTTVIVTKPVRFFPRILCYVLIYNSGSKCTSTRDILDLRTRTMNTTAIVVRPRAQNIFTIQCNIFVRFCNR